MRVMMPALLGAIVLASSARAQIVEVQLKEEMSAEGDAPPPPPGIRGWEIPEKRPVRQLVEGQRGLEPSEELMLEEIGDRLMLAPSGRQQAMPGFAVRGYGADALREVHRVMALGGSKTVDFRPTEPLSIVFFTYGFDRRVRVSKVEREGETVRVTYRLLAARSGKMNAYLAIVPLAGTEGAPASVEFVAAEGSGPQVPELSRWIEKVVSRSFLLGDRPRRGSARVEQYQGRWLTPRTDLFR